MAKSALDHVNAAFSAADTSIYDSYGKKNIITYARNIVYSHIFKYLGHEDTILDIAAGTGSDVLFFARKGFSIDALDISDGMVTKLRNKMEKHNLEKQVSIFQRSFTDLVELPPKSYDYVYSNFGGLNCIPDLRLIKEGLFHVLKPKGFVTLVIMPPICPWELFYLPKNRRIAMRRLGGIGGKGVPSKIKGNWFNSYYFTPRAVMKALGPQFKKVDLQGLCIFTPPLYMDHVNFASERSRLFSFLNTVDHYLSRIPGFSAIGDFFILTLQYNP